MLLKISSGAQHLQALLIQESSVLQMLACNLCEGKSQRMIVRNCKVSGGFYAQYHMLHVRISLFSDLHTVGGTCTTA